MPTSHLERLAQARSALADGGPDPWLTKLRTAVRRIESISSAALLDMLHEPATTGTARRLATNMRSLGFIPIKSRRLLPGGFHGTVIRGWTRPLRQPTSPPTMEPTGTAGPNHLVSNDR
jgi:hypothetical protein